MAKKKLTIKVKEQLENLVHEYGVHKAKFNTIKERCDTENAEIKNIMKEYELSEFISGDYIAELSIQKRKSVNEEILLEVAKKHCNVFKDIIKTKEYIDSDALEKAIYNNQIPKKVLLELDKAQDVKEVPTLRITKKKKEKTS